MPTQCSQEELDFGSCGGRKLVGAFDGGAITSNGGVLLLGAADRSIRLTDRLAKCFRDLRLADGITHTIADLLRQRIFGLALGYEDLIDHDNCATIRRSLPCSTSPVAGSPGSRR